MAGKVLERIDAGPYSYLRLETATGEQWAAVPKCEAAKGDQVAVINASTMDGFESKTLNRKFEHIVFGFLQGPAGSPAAPHDQPSPHGAAVNPHATAPAAAPDTGPIVVARATGPNAATVAEIFQKKNTLANKPVVVHAKVVKVLPGIMGKNWLHLRDGSGSAEKSDNDLTVTTQDIATVGSVVQVNGIVHADKDFGSGYRFSVIVEDAKVSK
ncbi:MAG TPA: nucleotide-binding protein [Polyangia bacterium]